MTPRALISAALLLACAGGAALIVPDERAPGAEAGRQSPAREAGEGYVAVYRNGDLELNIRGAAGLDLFRSGLASFFRDERGICTEAAKPAPAAQAMLGSAPELGMLGAGFALLGWTRRRGSWFDRLKQGLRFDVFPWPALCWLD